MKTCIELSFLKNCIDDFYQTYADMSLLYLFHLIKRKFEKFNTDFYFDAIANCINNCTFLMWSLFFLSKSQINKCIIVENICRINYYCLKLYSRPYLNSYFTYKLFVFHWLHWIFSCALRPFQSVFDIVVTPKVLMSYNRKRNYGLCGFNDINSWLTISSQLKSIKSLRFVLISILVIT